MRYSFFCCSAIRNFASIKLASILLIFIFYGLSIAAYEPEPIVNKEKVKYINMNEPSNKDTYLDFVTPYNKGFLPYEDCSEMSNFKIANLSMKLQYRFVKRSELGYPWYYVFGVRYQYDTQFHVVKIDYEVTCRNKLSYRGTEYLTSPTKILNNTTPGNGEKGERMEDEAYDFITISPEEYKNYIHADGTITKDVKHGEWSAYIIAKIDTNAILNKWTEQKVKYPEYTFMGTPGKLARPVLLIHGLDSDYKVWGDSTEYDKEKDFKNFKKGEVIKYENGSLPDMIARSNNLDTRLANINNNGIYFFQSPGGKVNGIWEDAKPYWGADTNTSQSRELYEKIIEVMDDFYTKNGYDWTLSNEFQIDLVGHSQGGLVIREMLRGLRAEAGIPQGTKNAANHINRVITVNTPHFGSALATKKENLDKIESEFSGVVPIIEDLENANPKERTFVKADVDVRFWEKFDQVYAEIDGYAIGTGLVAGCVIGIVAGGGLLGCLALTGVGFVVGAILGFFGALGGAAATDVTLEIKGTNYIGTYIPEVSTDWGTSVDVDIDTIKTMEEYADVFRKIRTAGEHLDKNSPFMQGLNNANKDGMFPLRPDGSKITLLPMYSDSTNKMLPELFEMAGEEANKLCANGDRDQNCFATGAVFKRYAYDMSGYKISKPEFDQGLLDVLLGIQDNWLSYGDAIVEASSQKFISNNNKPDNKYFLEPRNYAVHDAIAPWEPVIHGPKWKYKGAPQQGLDILCALSSACDKAFVAAKGNRSSVLNLSEAIYNGEFNEKSLDVTGDFDLAPVYISEGIQALSLYANGETVLTAKYEPGKGSSIILNDITEQKSLARIAVNSNQAEFITGAEFATQPSIARKGDSVYVTFTNYSGKSFSKVYFLPELSSNLTVAVMSSGEEMSPVIIGKATATNPETQRPPTPPPGHRLAPVTLAAMHREARGEHEANTSRPRILVFNATDKTLEFSKIAYYFTADTARVPNVVVDYPQVPVSIEHLGGDQWRFVLDFGSQKIEPKSLYPSVDGWQIRMHYKDWYDFDHFDDWSADYSIGIPKLNRKIVIYDKAGKIIWGNEAPEVEIEEEEEIILTPQATISWKDDSPWETNALKPRITIKNTGDVALADYHAELYFRVPKDKNLAIPSPDDWYTPESTPSVKNVGGTVWKLDLHFDKHILYPADSVSEGNIGLHLTDWSNFDKTVCGAVLKDRDGNILHGTEPSVAECESYSESLLMPLFTKRW